MIQRLGPTQKFLLTPQFNGRVSALAVNGQWLARQFHRCLLCRADPGRVSFASTRSPSMDAESREMLARRGESWFQLNICKKGGAGRPLFRPTYLGNQWPTVDYLVEALGRRCDPAAFFFAQVKCSENANGGAIPVTLRGEMLRRLVAIPAPTYIIGIDDVNESGYILSVNGHRGPLRSVPRTFPMDVENRERLWREVVGFWQQRTVPMPFTSVFQDPRTR